MQSRTARIGDITMRWEEAGTGAPVILVHGIPTSPALWRDVAPLIEGRRVIAWEMPGYGASMPEGEHHDIAVAAQADHLVSWMRNQGIERAILAGHDLGGGVVQIAAVRHPDMVEGLFLTNAICYDSWPVPLIKGIAMAGSILKHAPDGSLQKLLRMIYSKGHGSDATAEAAFNAHAPHYERHGGAKAFVRQAQALDVDDTTAIADQLATLAMPARIAWGAADEFQKIEYGERLASDLRAPLRRIEGGMHFTPEDHPGVIAEEINALIRTVDG